MTPKLSFELYAQPLISSVDYGGLRALERPKTYDFVPTTGSVAAGRAIQAAAASVRASEDVRFTRVAPIRIGIRMLLSRSWLLPPTAFDPGHAHFWIAIGAIAIWRYSLGALHFLRGTYFLHVAYPRARRAAAALEPDAHPAASRAAGLRSRVGAPHMPRMTVPLSVLDLAPIVEGGNAADALRHTLDLAHLLNLAVALLALGALHGMVRRGLAVHRLAPLLTIRVVRALVALDAARLHVHASTHRREHAVDRALRWIRHVRQAGTVTAFALHVLVAIVFRCPPAARRVGRDVAEIVDRVTWLTESLHLPARLERGEGVGVRGLLPLALLAHVAVATHRELRVLVVVSQEARCRHGRCDPRRRQSAFRRATTRAPGRRTARSSARQIRQSASTGFRPRAAVRFASRRAFAPSAPPDRAGRRPRRACRKPLPARCRNWP